MLTNSICQRSNTKAIFANLVKSYSYKCSNNSLWNLITLVLNILKMKVQINE